MKVTEAQRLELRERLTEAIGSDSTTVLMEALPPVDYDTLATKDDLDTQRVALEARIDSSSAGLRVEMADLRSDLRTEMADLRGDLRTDLATHMRIMVAANVGSIVGVAALVSRFG